MSSTTERTFISSCTKPSRPLLLLLAAVFSLYFSRLNRRAIKPHGNFERRRARRERRAAPRARASRYAARAQAPPAPPSPTKRGVGLSPPLRSELTKWLMNTRASSVWSPSAWKSKRRCRARSKRLAGERRRDRKSVRRRCGAAGDAGNGGGRPPALGRATRRRADLHAQLHASALRGSGRQHRPLARL